MTTRKHYTVNSNLKILNLHDLINSEHPDIIIGTETWLTPDVLNNEIFPPKLNYIVYRKDRTDGYGGVLISIIQHLLPSCEVPLQ